MATYQLPHHKLIAYEVAKELLGAVRETHVRDAGLRDQALRSAKSACLNCAEGAGRVTRADKARVFRSLGPKRARPRRRSRSRC